MLDSRSYGMAVPNQAFFGGVGPRSSAFHRLERCTKCMDSAD